MLIDCCADATCVSPDPPRCRDNRRNAGAFTRSQRAELGPDPAAQSPNPPKFTSVLPRAKTIPDVLGNLEIPLSFPFLLNGLSIGEHTEHSPGFSSAPMGPTSPAATGAQGKETALRNLKLKSNCKFNQNLCKREEIAVCSQFL